MSPHKHFKQLTSIINVLHDVSSQILNPTTFTCKASFLFQKEHFLNCFWVVCCTVRSKTKHKTNKKTKSRQKNSWLFSLCGLICWAHCSFSGSQTASASRYLQCWQLKPCSSSSSSTAYAVSSISFSPRVAGCWVYRLSVTLIFIPCQWLYFFLIQVNLICHHEALIFSDFEYSWRISQSSAGCY